MLVFSVVFAVFFISPALLSSQFALYSLMKIGDVVDLFTPLILIPFYWLLYQVGRDELPRLNESLFFLVLAALWVEGQGLHLSANSIGHLLNELKGSDAYALTNFYDEVLSHYMWHTGVVGLTLLIIFRQWQHPFLSEHAAPRLEILAGLIYGFTYFGIILEGNTVPLGVPFAILVTLFGLIWGWKRLKQQPLLMFFTVAHLMATVLFAGWAIYWGGLPEFSEVGLIG